MLCKLFVLGHINHMIKNNFINTTCVKTTSSPSDSLKYLSLEYGKTNDEINGINLHLFQKSFQLKPEMYSCIIPNENSFIKPGLVDKNFFKNQLLKTEEIDLEKRIFKIYEDLGNKTRENSMTNIQKFFSKYFKKMKFPIFLYPKKEQDLSRLLISKILSQSNQIAMRTKRGPGNFVIVNTQLGSIIQDSSYFTFNPYEPKPNSMITPIGQIPGLTVYVNPLMDYNDNKIIVGKNTRNDEIGTILVEGEDRLDRSFEQIQYFERPHEDQLVLKTQRALFHIEGAENMYYTQEILLKKKPLWRRLFKL